MTQSPHAISIDVTRAAGQVVVTLTGRSEARMPVSYTLEVSGRSSTRHAGSSAVGPQPHTLSTVRFADVAPWQIDFEASENGKPPYHYRCTSDGGECAER